jgi:hypothetical protein
MKFLIVQFTTSFSCHIIPLRSKYSFLYNVYVKRNPTNNVKGTVVISILVFVFQIHQQFSDGEKSVFNWVFLRQEIQNTLGRMLH